jgi:hypothetical protein
MDKVVHSKRPRKRGMKKNTTHEGCLLFFSAVSGCSALPSWTSVVDSFCTPEATNHGWTASAEELNRMDYIIFDDVTACGLRQLVGG